MTCFKTEEYTSFINGLWPASSRQVLVCAKCRPTIDRVSTNYWPIHRSSIDQLSAKCRRNVGEVSVNEKLYRPRHIWNDYRPVSRPSVDPLSTDYRPLYRATVDRVSSDCRPSVDQLSTECRPLYRPLYRPISRSTLPTVNKIHLHSMYF